MKKTAVIYERTHSLRDDDEDGHEIILERDPFRRPKSHRITVLSGQNGLEEKPSKSDVDLPKRNRRSWEREEEVLLNNESSIDDEDAAGKLRKWSKSKIDLLMPSLRSLVTLARGKSSSSSSLNQPGSAESWSHLECIRNDEPIRKYNTMVTLSNVVLNRPAGIKPINRLRDAAVCSRCSSVLSLAASSSRYSLGSTSSFVTHRDQPIVLCKVCLNEVPVKNSWTLQQCGCSYCIECVKAYVDFEINQGAYNISCPDAQCPKQGIIQLEEIEALVSIDEIEKHQRYRLNKEVEMDKSRMWCPKPGCETVCNVGDRSRPHSVICPTCQTEFCSGCRATWHPGKPCPPPTTHDMPTFDSDLIKCCPMCSVPIEKDEGCAQMLCKRCKHVFCWYCLASLDDDFLLRHYDKGPCKNKLGHSRASVIWHRTQVIGIFAGFGILLLVASPLLLLAAPCIVCCKCRVCTSGSKLDDPDDDIIDEPN